MKVTGLEKLPIGSRVIYAPEPHQPLEDPRGAIREALLNPLGDSQPLPTLLFSGMKLTIAFDDISLPLPPMERPDIREMVIEEVLEMAAAAGVDDVEIIAALALHRRMTEAELRHAVGDRVYDSFAPSGKLYNHDAEDPDGLTNLGQTKHGEDVIINKRAAESDLLVYVNINLVAMDGGWKSTATGLSGYQSLKSHHNVKDDAELALVHGPPQVGTPLLELAYGQGHQRLRREDLPDRDHPEQRCVPRAVRLSSRARVGVECRAIRAGFIASSKALDRTPARLKRSIFQNIKAPHRMTSVQAGEVEAVHEVTTANVYKQQLVTVEGQTDILTMGLPYICPYNVNSIMNPILVMCLGLGYFFNLYKNKPLVREGGVLIMSHPTPWEFHPVHHPSYIDFFEQVLSVTTDPEIIERDFEKQFAEDEWYRHLYRTSYAYHGVHPFYMWYWGSHALQHLGKVIIVGGDVKSVRRLGFTPGLHPSRRSGNGVRRGRFEPVDHAHSQPTDLPRRRSVKVGVHMKLSSSKLTDVTAAKSVCLVTIAASCVVIGIRIVLRGHV